MGDCAVVIFHDPPTGMVSPAVYLHHHGGCVLALLETGLPLMRTGDAGYSCARFIGHCHTNIPGITGLGVYNLPAMPKVGNESPADYTRTLAAAREFNFGQRGIYLVDVSRWRVEHAGSTVGQYGDYGDGFDQQESTTLKSIGGIVELPAHLAGPRS